MPSGREVLMKARRIAAAVVASSAVVAVAVLTLGSSAATNASSSHLGWVGQPAKSVADAMRIAHAGAPDTLTVTAQAVRQVPVDVGAQGSSPGDFFLLDLRLFDETGQTHVGRAEVRCEEQIQTENCRAAFRIFGHGQLVIDGTFYPNENFELLSILGGTRDYKGAGGSVQVLQTTNTQVLVLHFTH
jgi:hypothetical protein